MSTRLILIRHGETDWNKKKLYLSFTDIELNENGKIQARELYKRLRKEKIRRIYSSDYRRAKNFADIVFKGLRIEDMSSLREMDFGVFEGLTHQKVMRKFSPIYKKWLKNPDNVSIPGGENLKNFRKRVRGALKQILALNRNGSVAVITHAGPIKIIVSDVLRSKDTWNIRIDLASMSIIEFKKNKKPLICLLNDT